jgi:L-ribulokinase
MAHLKEGRILPDPAAASLYDRIYRDWLELHDHFGRGGSGVMARARLRRGRGDLQ